SDLATQVLRHPYKKGHGAAVKTGVLHCRGDIIVLMSANGQHPAADIPRLIEPLGRYDLVVGARTADSPGTRLRKGANRLYNILASYLAEFPIADLTSSFRAFRADVLKRLVHLFPDGFSYSATSTIAVIKGGYHITHVPVRMREGEHKVGPGIVVTILKVAALFHPLKVFGTASLLAMLLGIVSTALTLSIEGRLHIPNSAVLLFFAGLLVFLMGLVAEQIAALRLEYGERLEGGARAGGRIGNSGDGD
ncbi:MAG: glycosyltransferase family 2 protein, partial [Acidobacteriota bacterium]